MSFVTFETLDLSKSPSPISGLDHSAFAQYADGSRQYVVFRDSPGTEVDIMEGTAYAMVTPFVIPKGMRRLRSMADYGKEPGEGDYGNELLTIDEPDADCGLVFLLDDLRKELPKVAGVTVHETAFSEYCAFPRAARGEFGFHEYDPEEMVSNDDTRACVKPGRTGTAGRRQPTKDESKFIWVEWDWYNSIPNKKSLRDKLVRRHFASCGTKPVLMMGVVLPNRTFGWVPFQQRTHQSRHRAFERFMRKPLVFHRPVYLDGPNIWIGKLDNSWWYFI
jgi:hypothetical protein